MLISIYMPTHNRANSLLHAIESVQSQTYKSWELIVVDDASTDSTAELMRSVSAQDARIHYIRQDTRSGAPIARNRAIALAAGDYITGLDDDDTFHPERLSSMVTYWNLLSASLTKVSGIYSQEAHVVNGQITGFSRKEGSVGSDNLVRQNGIGNQLFAPKKHYVDAGLFDPDLPAWQDLELFMRITAKFGPARLIDAPLYNQDVTLGSGRISSKRALVCKAYEMVVAKHFTNDRRKQQILMFQLYSSYYGTRPSLAEFLHFIRLGWWARGILRMARLLFTETQSF